MHDNMHMHRKHLLLPARLGMLVFAAGILFAALSSFAQKADVNVNIFGAFPSTATGPAPNVNGETFSPVRQTADPSAGFRMGARYVFSPVFGLEANFSYSRATQHFTGNAQQSGVVYSHAKSFTIDYVATPKIIFHGFQPFILAGGGVISYNISSFAALPARPEYVPVFFEYGGGADYHPAQFPNFMAMRFEYRGLVGHAPDYLLPYLATSKFINIAEPQVGLVFRF
jgi:opacity protein-like surface antigen